MQNKNDPGSSQAKVHCVNKPSGSIYSSEYFRLSHNYLNEVDNNVKRRTQSVEMTPCHIEALEIQLYVC